MRGGRLRWETIGEGEQLVLIENVNRKKGAAATDRAGYIGIMSSRI